MNHFQIKRPYEQWKILPGTMYSISNYGDAVNTGTGRTLSKIEINGRVSYTLRIDGKSVQYFAHILVAMLFLGYDRTDKTHCIRHVDKNHKNNFVSNLQVLSRSKVNYESNRKSKTSRFSGVSWNRFVKKWVAYISVDGKRKHLGYFDNEDDANLAFQTFLTVYYNK